MEDEIENEKPTSEDDIREISEALFGLDMRGWLPSQKYPTPERREENIRPRGEFTPLIELLDEPEEETSWTVDNLLPAGGFSIIAAKPKVGKSTLARQLALCVARGEPFLGRETKQGAVLYVSLEDKRGEVRKHFKLLGATGAENIGIYVGSVPEKAQKWLESEVRLRQPVLVIIDTLFRFAPVANVNDYSEVTAALSPLLALAREYSVHVLVVHHGRKGGGEGGDATLGSTAIFGTVDTSIALRRTENKRTIETQQRYGTDMEVSVLVFDEATKSLVLGGTKEEEDTREIESAILDFFGLRSEPADEPSVNEGVDGRTGLKRKALRGLVQKGSVIRTGAGRRGDPFLYSCSLVPDISTGQEKQEIGNQQKANAASPDSRSLPSRESNTDWGGF